jgi:hypothetical protein
VLQPKTFFGVLGQIVQNCLRFVINLGRQYQIIPAAYLVAFSICLIGYAYQPASSHPLSTSPTPQQEPVSLPTSSPSPSPEPSPTTSPQAQAPESSPTSAYAPTSDTSDPEGILLPPPPTNSDYFTAVRWSEKVTVFWTKLVVSNVQIKVDGLVVPSTCEGRVETVTNCQITLSEGSQLEVAWTESGNYRFRARFKIKPSDGRLGRI